jgi:hypothetical protein
MPSKKADTVRVHVVLTRKQYATFSKLAGKLGFSISELLRRAIDFFLAAEKRRRDKDGE